MVLAMMTARGQVPSIADSVSMSINVAVKKDFDPESSGNEIIAVGRHLSP
ncbi:hypothetical protein P3342_001589 [Pyrenophora teres f. teres]|nr:hypothetical protein P3342_001589 [Pyrenophora teres f. teres]